MKYNNDLTLQKIGDFGSGAEPTPLYQHNITLKQYASWVDLVKMTIINDNPNPMTIYDIIDFLTANGFDNYTQKPYSHVEGFITHSSTLITTLVYLRPYGTSQLFLCYRDAINSTNEVEIRSVNDDVTPTITPTP